MTNLTHNSVQCIYSNSLHVSSNLVLIIRRNSCINTTSGMSLFVGDIYQMLYWYNWFFWWLARGCSKHVENWNKYIEKNCESSWSFTRNIVCVLIFSTTFVWNSSYSRRIQRDVVNVHSSSCKVPVFLVRFEWNFELYRQILEKYL